MLQREATEDDDTSTHPPAANIFPYAPSFGKAELRIHWKDSIHRIILH